MDEAFAARSACFQSLLDVWSGADLELLTSLIADDYVGHMLHSAAGDRTAAQYAGRIAAYRTENPGTRFVVVDQAVSEDRLWSRVVATHGDGRQAHGMNVSRFTGNLIAEEWAIWSGWQE